MSDDDDFQSTRRAESSFAALSWSRQGQIMLITCTGACAGLWSTQLKHCHSSGGSQVREMLPPFIPLTLHNSTWSRSKLLVVHHGRQGFEEWKAGLRSRRWEHARKEFDQGTRNRPWKQDLNCIWTQPGLKNEWRQISSHFIFWRIRPTPLDWGQGGKKKKCMCGVFWVEVTLNYSNQQQISALSTLQLLKHRSSAPFCHHAWVLSFTESVQPENFVLVWTNPVNVQSPAKKKKKNRMASAYRWFLCWYSAGDICLSSCRIWHQHPTNL